MFNPSDNDIRISLEMAEEYYAVYNNITFEFIPGRGACASTSHWLQFYWWEAWDGDILVDRTLPKGSSTGSENWEIDGDGFYDIRGTSWGGGVGEGIGMSDSPLIGSQLMDEMGITSYTFHYTTILVVDDEPVFSFSWTSTPDHTYQIEAKSAGPFPDQYITSDSFPGHDEFGNPVGVINPITYKD
jgi:hypothetical protein